MAYENYNFVSWTTGTPITGERLGQMSTNIEQVKDATDDKPQGILRFKQSSVTSTTYSDFTEHELIALEDEGGSDNRVSVNGNRYYKLVVNFPGFRIKGRGTENSTYRVNVYQGEFGGANTLVTRWTFTPHIFAFYNTAAEANTTTVSVKATGQDTIIGSGTHSYVLSSNSSGLVNESFFVTVDRTSTANTTNAPSYDIPASISSIQFYVEDTGGV
jgi:hypothetical protein